MSEAQITHVVASSLQQAVGTTVDYPQTRDNKVDMSSLRGMIHAAPRYLVRYHMSA